MESSVLNFSVNIQQKYFCGTMQRLKCREDNKESSKHFSVWNNLKNRLEKQKGSAAKYVTTVFFTHNQTRLNIQFKKKKKKKSCAGICGSKKDQSSIENSYFRGDVAPRDKFKEEEYTF